MSEQMECIICAEFHSDVQNDVFVVAECEHIFHKHCMLKHLLKFSKCPACRKIVKPNRFRVLRGVEPMKPLRRFIIATLGDCGSGKTGLVNRFVKGVFENNEVSTIGADFRNITVKVGEEYIKLFIQDCGGNFMFKAITPQYIRNAHGIIIAYDCSRYETLTNAQGWLDFANQHAPAAEKILIGCRSDLERCTCYKHVEVPCRKPTHDEIEMVATSLGLFHVTTSALSAHNVDIAFRTLASKIMENGYLLRHVRNNLNDKLNSGSSLKLHHPPIQQDEVGETGTFNWCGLRQLFRKFRKSGNQDNSQSCKIE